LTKIRCGVPTLMNLLKVGDWVALTPSTKDYFLKSDYSEHKVNSLTQVEDVYERIKAIKLKGFVSPVTFDEVIQLRFIDTEMPASYNVAMNTFYNKLCEHTEQLSNLQTINWLYSYYDNAVKVNPLVKELLKQTEEELDYELSEGQASTAIGYFINDKLRSNGDMD
jgi:hypothetical protein